MAAYTEWETVRDVLAPDGDLDGTAASLGQVMIEEAIERISARIDTFLTRRYSVPLIDPVPGIIHDIATDIAAYDLTLSYYKGVDIQDADPVIRRYRDARGMLGQLSTGLLVIDVPGADTTVDDPIVINPPGYPGSLPSPGYLTAWVVREIPPGGW